MCAQKRSSPADGARHFYPALGLRFLASTYFFRVKLSLLSLSSALSSSDCYTGNVTLHSSHHYPGDHLLGHRYFVMAAPRVSFGEKDMENGEERYAAAGPVAFLGLIPAVSPGNHTRIFR